MNWIDLVSSANEPVSTLWLGNLLSEWQVRKRLQLSLQIVRYRVYCLSSLEFAQRKILETYFVKASLVLLCLLLFLSRPLLLPQFGSTVVCSRVRRWA